MTCSWLHLLKSWSLLKFRGDSQDIYRPLLSGQTLDSGILSTLRELVSSAVPSVDAAQVSERMKAGIEILKEVYSPAERYWLWARFGLLTLGLVATILYYIRWEDKWAQQHADAEMQLQQFQLDINRANWVLESCLEWRRATDNSLIPTELLASMTRGLFSDP